MKGGTTVNATMGAGHIPGNMKHYVYQRVHTLGGKTMHLDEHLRIAARAFEHIYGSRPDPAPEEIAARIAGYLKMLRSPARTSATVMLYFVPRKEGADGRGDTFPLSGPADITVEYERGLLDAGYTLSALRPKAVTYDYSIPFAAFPTNFQFEAQALFDTLASRQHGAARSIRREDDRLLSCGDSPLFAIRGRTLFTAPLTDGAMESVERELVIAAAASSRLGVREEPILGPELKSYDELFFADAAGITSLAECDGAKFMSLVAPRLATALE